jgi:hypothetical protein
LLPIGEYPYGAIPLSLKEVKMLVYTLVTILFLFNAVIVFSFFKLGAFGLSKTKDILSVREKIMRFRKNVVGFKVKMVKASRDAKVLRDISIGIFASSLVGFGSSTDVGVTIWYFILILLSIFGIINANDKTEE